MNAWYKIWDISFPEKKEAADGYVVAKDDDVISNYIGLDSLMQVIHRTDKETEAGS